MKEQWLAMLVAATLTSSALPTYAAQNEIIKVYPEHQAPADMTIYEEAP